MQRGPPRHLTPRDSIPCPMCVLATASVYTQSDRSPCVLSALPGNKLSGSLAYAEGWWRFFVHGRFPSGHGACASVIWFTNQLVKIGKRNVRFSSFAGNQDRPPVFAGRGLRSNGKVPVTNVSGMSEFLIDDMNACIDCSPVHWMCTLQNLAKSPLTQFSKQSTLSV